MQIGPRQQELLGFWVHFSYFGVKPGPSFRQNATGRLRRTEKAVNRALASPRTEGLATWHWALGLGTGHWALGTGQEAVGTERRGIEWRGRAVACEVLA